MWRKPLVTYGYRTCMMNFPKGADLFRKENQVLKALNPSLCYGIVYISEKNDNFLNTSRPALNQPEEVVSPAPEQLPSKPQPPVLTQSKNPTALERQVEKHRQQQILRQQTLGQFLMESLTLEKPQHKLFWAMALSFSIILVKVYTDLNYPSQLGSKSKLIKVCDFSFPLTMTEKQLEKMSGHMDVEDQLYTDLLEKARKGEI